MISAGTEAELQVREATSNERAAHCSQRPVDCHNCGLAESPRVT